MTVLNVEPRTIFCHDNLEVLQGINSSCIDLIYLDPPFNKKKQFTAPVGSSAAGASFSDIFREKDIKDEWVTAIDQDNHVLHNYLTGIKSFSNIYNYCYLVYMSIRLFECHRILKDTGSLYLHCDQTMSHYLKVVLDCIFGEKNFRNEVIWCYHAGGASKRYFPRKHDTLLLYGRDAGRSVHNILRAPYRDFYAYQPDHDPAMGVYHPEGKMLHDWWEISLISSKASERTGYPTQKPLALMDQIIRASSNEGDLVLDPFCGCATTCIASEKLNRKWIGIDVSHKAYDLVRERLRKEVPDDLIRGEPNYTTEPPVRNDGQEAGDGERKYVYIISNPAYPGEYKVGVARNADDRLGSYQTSDPNRGYRLEYKFLTRLYNEIERHVHRELDSRHEWVKAPMEKIRALIENYESEP